MLKLRTKGLRIEEIELLSQFLVDDYYNDYNPDDKEENQKRELYFKELVKEFKTECNFIIYDLGVQATYIVVLRIDKKNPIIEFDEFNREMIAYEKSLVEYCIEYVDGHPIVYDKVHNWDFINCERLQRRMLFENKRTTYK